MKKEKNPSKEALNAAALPKFFSGPSWRQARAVLLVFGIPRDNSYSTENSMNPGNETQAPVGRIKTNNTGTNLVEAHSAH
jgi:hypothetical protein